jgi:hypothetical protein
VPQQPRILLDGMEWQNSDQALRKLKLMLWGFVVLREFGDKLENAIETITKACNTMKASLEEVPQKKNNGKGWPRI